MSNIKSKHIIQCNDELSIDINGLWIKCRRGWEVTPDYRSGKRKLCGEKKYRRSIPL